MSISYTRSKLLMLYKRGIYPLNVARQASNSKVLFSAAGFDGLRNVNYQNSIGFPRRFCHACPQGVKGLDKFQNFITKTSCGRWLWNRKYYVLGFCISCKIMYESVECVPISDKIHFVHTYKIVNWLGSTRFPVWWKERFPECWKEKAEENAGRILGPTSPESIRVQKILTEIVQAMHDMLGLENNCTVSVFVPKNNDSRISKNASLVLGARAKSDLDLSNSKERVHSIKPKRTGKFGLKYGTKHLDGLNWEVMVVDADEGYAGYVPNGKIAIHTAVFKRLKDPQSGDLEIAVCLGHEVGHGVAQRSCVYDILLFCLLPLRFILAFFRRREELEVDYIGMMLMAAAGYDPQHAPEVYKKHGAIEVNIMEATHPSGETRAKKLKKVKVMRKALDIYNRVQAGHQDRNLHSEKSN